MAMPLGDALQAKDWHSILYWARKSDDVGDRGKACSYFINLAMSAAREEAKRKAFKSANTKEKSFVSSEIHSAHCVSQAERDMRQRYELIEKNRKRTNFFHGAPFPVYDDLKKAVAGVLKNCHVQDILIFATMAHEALENEWIRVTSETDQWWRDHADEIVAQYRKEPIVRIPGSPFKILATHGGYVTVDRLIECARLVDQCYSETYYARSDDDRMPSGMETVACYVIDHRSIRSLARAELGRRELLHLAGPEPKPQVVKKPV